MLQGRSAPFSSTATLTSFPLVTRLTRHAGQPWRQPRGCKGDVVTASSIRWPEITPLAFPRCPTPATCLAFLTCNCRRSSFVLLSVPCVDPARLMVPFYLQRSPAFRAKCDDLLQPALGLFLPVSSPMAFSQRMLSLAFVISNSEGFISVASVAECLRLFTLPCGILMLS